MQKLKYIYLIILLSSLALFTTCRKYPEGGWSNVAIKHLFGKNVKGSSKTWRLKKYEVNGIDSTGFITPGNGFNGFENNEFLFRIPEDSKSLFYCETKVYNCGIYFLVKKKTLSFSVGRFIAGIHDLQCYKGVCERNVLNPYNLTQEMIWKINKLTHNELIITMTQNGNTYKIILNN